MTEMKERYVVWYERPVTGRFTVLDLSEDVPAIGKGGKPLSGLSHSTAEAEADRLNAARSRPAARQRSQSDLLRSSGRKIHSRQTVNSTAMMTGPKNKPSRPKAASPPKIPTNAKRKGSRAAPPTRVGHTK